MRRRWSKILLLLAAGGLSLPGCAHWGASKPTTTIPTNQVQAANQAQAANQGQAGAKPGWLKQWFTQSDPPRPDRPKPTAAETKDGQMSLARLYERRGDAEQAEAIYQHLAKRYPDDPLPHHRLAVLAVQQGKFRVADEQFRAAQALAPPSAELLSDIGYTCYLEGRLDDAEAALNQALVKEPQHKAATNNLALVLGTRGRFEEALVLFKRTCSEAEAYSNLAYVLSQSGDLKRAEQAYLCALTLDSRMRPAAQALIQVAQQRQNEDRMIARRRTPGDKSAAPEVTADRPKLPAVDNALVSVAEGRKLPERPSPDRRPSSETDLPPSAGPAKLVSAEESIDTPPANPRSSVAVPVEPDVTEVQISESAPSNGDPALRSLPPVEVASQPNGSLAEKASFEAAMTGRETNPPTQSTRTPGSQPHE